jgi:GNAT superfamily N-acetyltransferase
MLLREAERKDMPEILELIKELAKIRKDENLTISVYDLMRDGFSENPCFYMYVAESEREIVGFALFYKAFSLVGKSIFIEDVFVTKSYKKQGIALSLFSKVLDFSLDNKVNKIVWLLQKKYTSLKELYLRAGATILDNLTVAVSNKKDIEKIVSTNLDTNSEYFNIRFIDNKDAVGVLAILDESDKYKNRKHTIDVYDFLKYGFGENPWFKMLIVEVNKKIVGYIIFHDAYATFLGKSVHIDEIFIKPELQGMGLGKLMYYYFFNYANKMGYNKVTQAINYTDERSKKIISFYNGKYNPELQIVEITDETLKTFLNSKDGNT